MEKLNSISDLVVRQRKELAEIITGFETKNAYSIEDVHGQQLYVAAEGSGSTMMRIFLRAFRPFTIRIFAGGSDVMSLQILRPFRWYFHRVEVEDGQGQLIGVVERQFNWLNRRYVVTCTPAQKEYYIESPMLSPWTFYIRDSKGVEQGKITKKWGGLIKEAISNADDFGVTWPAQWDAGVKSVLLGAVFLIDFIYFESRGQS
tara:strand:+ start:1889 stop:2497 length:609 start_codon:yes stop_codon:yes gene_type:complete